MRASASPRAMKSRRRRTISPARTAWPSAWLAARTMRARAVVIERAAAVAEHHLQGAHRVADGGQRLVQFVRQGRGHLAHGAEPGDVGQFGAQLRQVVAAQREFRLGAPFLGDVAVDADGPQHARLPANRRTAARRGSRAPRRRRGACAPRRTAAACGRRCRGRGPGLLRHDHGVELRRGCRPARLAAGPTGARSRRRR